MKRVVVTGCGPASINIQKSLRLVDEEIFIIATDSNPYHLHFSLANKNYLISGADNPEYITKLNKIIDEEKIDFIIPQPDIEVKIVGLNRNLLSAKTFLPNQTTIETCQDKFLTYCVLKSAKVPVPKTQIMNDTFYPYNLIEGKKDYPFWVRATKGAGGRASTLVYNKEMMRNWVQYWLNRGMKIEDFIVQEYLPRKNIAFHSIWKDGELLTSMARERLEYIYPHLSPSGITGTPSVQRTIHDSKVNEVSTKAVLAIDKKYNGIACIDLKENSEGIPCVTEINPGRMFTTSYFFSYASQELYGNWHANFPYLLLKLAYNEDLPKLPKYNALPPDLYWVRHIDCPARMITNIKSNQLNWCEK